MSLGYPRSALKVGYGTLGSLAIPKWWTGTRRPVSSENFAHICGQIIGAHEAIGALYNSDGAFCVLAQREAWNVEVCGFLLKST